MEELTSGARQQQSPPANVQPGTRPVRVGLIIPALNEEESIGGMLQGLASAARVQGFTDALAQVIVVDNGSTDRTAEIARNYGAMVVRESRRGYGSACLAGLSALRPDVSAVLFMDADGSDHPEDFVRLLAPIGNGEADLVVGSRILGLREPGSLTWPQSSGNRLATFLLRALYGARYSDLGPFRIIRRDALARLQMRDADYGWTIEMQIRAHLANLRVQEVPVRHRRRHAGNSKVSGTVVGSVRAGVKIMWTILRYRILAIRSGRLSGRP